jgi:outer membrane protein OmpA-like peptidoglycan-associated protein
MNKKLVQLLAASVATIVLSYALTPIALAQSSASEAEEMLQEAETRLDQAKKDGSDTSALEAEIDATKAALETLRQAEPTPTTQTSEPANPEPTREPSPSLDQENSPSTELGLTAEPNSPEPEIEPAPASEPEKIQPEVPIKSEPELPVEPVTPSIQAEPAPKLEPEPLVESAPMSEPEKIQPEVPIKSEPELPVEPVTPSIQAEPAPILQPEPQPETSPKTEAPIAIQPEPKIETTSPVANEPTPASSSVLTIEPPVNAPTISEPTLAPLPENSAPLLDSAKESPVPAKANTPLSSVESPTLTNAVVPNSDAQAIEQIKAIEVTSTKAEEGVKVTTQIAPPAPPSQNIITVINNSTITNVNNVYVINTPDTERLAYKSNDVFIERLPRDRLRETIVHDNGVQVVTITNRYGDIIQRSRILQNGREVFLSYNPEYDRQDFIAWRDPIYDLPPLVLTIPARDYILSVSLIDNRRSAFEPSQIYYNFLEKPPVERVERIYSLRDVKQSARVRDKVRRIDLDTLTFSFGDPEVKEDQIVKLEAVANAMLKLLAKNPAESFLIEGHTDAIGTDIANLALSEKRAASVARALTNVFGVPAENLTTQGYGERYLKVKTTKPNALNRRVAIRRITQLVTPKVSR